MTALPPGLRARVLRSTQTDAPLPARVLVTRRAIAALVPAVLIALIVATTRRGDLDATNLPSVALGAAVASVSALALLIAGLARGRNMLGTAAGTVLTVVLAGPIAVAIAAAAFIAPGAHSVTFTSAAQAIASSPRCALLATIVGAGTLAGLFYARRVIIAPNPTLVGACLGAASGAIGFLAVDAHCAAADAVHALVAHWLPMVLLAAFGALVGPKALKG